MSRVKHAKLQSIVSELTVVWLPGKSGLLRSSVQGRAVQGTFGITSLLWSSFFFGQQLLGLLRVSVWYA